MFSRYGRRGSRDRIREELGFSDDELDAIEDDAGFRLSSTFDAIRETTFDIEHDGDTVSKGRARTVTEDRPMQERDAVVLEYDAMDRGTLAHEAAHATMKQPDGDLFTELPADDTASQRVYAEFVAYLAEDGVRSLDTDGREAHRLRQARMEYEDNIDIAIEEAYDQAVQGDLVSSEKRFVARYQDAREQDLAAVAAESYDTAERPEMPALMSPDEQLYEETMAYIETVADSIEAYT